MSRLLWKAAILLAILLGAGIEDASAIEFDFTGTYERGLRNVEGESFVAPRNMIRFLGRIKAEYERFVVEQLDALTANRHLTNRCLGGTYKCVRSRSVPYWDENRFPLVPPPGYRSQTTTDWLGSNWNYVSICGRRGAGIVYRTETTTTSDGNGGTRTETRQIAETCGSCGGAGRLEFAQGIVAVWRVFSSSATSPRALLTEYMADAPERTFYERTFIENREDVLRELAEDWGMSDRSLELSRRAASRFVDEDAERHLRAILAYNDGRYMYRARSRRRVPDDSRNFPSRIRQVRLVLRSATGLLFQDDSA